MKVYIYILLLSYNPSFITVLYLCMLSLELPTNEVVRQLEVFLSKMEQSFGVTLIIYVFYNLELAFILCFVITLIIITPPFPIASQAIPINT